MEKRDSMVLGEEGPVETINPKDPPPEPTPGLVSYGFSARMSVPTPGVEDTSADPASPGAEDSQQ